MLKPYIIIIYGIIIMYHESVGLGLGVGVIGLLFVGNSLNVNKGGPGVLPRKIFKNLMQNCAILCYLRQKKMGC